MLCLKQHKNIYCYYAFPTKLTICRNAELIIIFRNLTARNKPYGYCLSFIYQVKDGINKHT